MDTNEIRIRVIGSINMDLVMQMERVPEEGETVLGDRYFFAPGGKGGNAAIAAARLGGKISFAGCVGNDIYGHELKQSLEKENVDTSLLLESDEVSTGFAPIFVQSSGQNRIIAFPGANRSVTAEDTEKLLSGDIDALMMQLEMDPELVISASNLAVSRSIPVILDAGPAQAFPLERMPGITILSPNETETYALTGILPDTIERMKEAAICLQHRSHCRIVVLKLGDRGAYIYSDTVRKQVPAFPIKAVDPTAAGDAFTGAMALKFLSTGNIEEAVLFGNAAGALTATRLGAQPSLPREEEVLSFLASHAGK